MKAILLINTLSLCAIIHILIAYATGSTQLIAAYKQKVKATEHYKDPVKREKELEALRENLEPYHQTGKALAHIITPFLVILTLPALETFSTNSLQLPPQIISLALGLFAFLLLIFNWSKPVLISILSQFATVIALAFFFTPGLGNPAANGQPQAFFQNPYLLWPLALTGVGLIVLHFSRQSAAFSYTLRMAQPLVVKIKPPPQTTTYHVAGYKCGNCGGTLPGPVPKCPHCNVTFGGQRNEYEPRPAAAGRTEKFKPTDIAIYRSLCLYAPLVLLVLIIFLLVNPAIQFIHPTTSTTPWTLSLLVLSLLLISRWVSGLQSKKYLCKENEKQAG